MAYLAADLYMRNSSALKGQSGGGAWLDYDRFNTAIGAGEVKGQDGYRVVGLLNGPLGKLFDLHNYLDADQTSDAFQDAFSLLAAAATAMYIYPAEFRQRLEKLKWTAPSHYELAKEICRTAIGIYAKDPDGSLEFRGDVESAVGYR
jgi:hypothetical protein